MNVRIRILSHSLAFFILLASCQSAPPAPEPPPASAEPPPAVQIIEREPASTPRPRLAMNFVPPTATLTPRPTVTHTPTPTPVSDVNPDNLGGGANAVAPTPVVQAQFLIPPVDPTLIAGLAIPPLNIVRADKTRPRIALTFDTGAGTPVVRMILTELKAAQVHATFFIVGNWAIKNGDLLRQMVAEGHDLANHSYNHPDFRSLSDEQMIAQLVTTEEIVKRETGCTTRPFFRAPFGSLNPHILQMLGQAGFQSIFWSAHGGDWYPNISMQTVKETTLNLSGNGGIIVLHSSVPETAQAVPEIITELRARGMEPVKLSELLTTDPAHPYRAPCEPKP